MTIAGDEDDWQSWPHCADHLRKLTAAHFRHREVRENEIYFLIACEHAERFIGALRRRRSISEQLEHPDRGLEDSLVVIHDQNTQPSHSLRTVARINEVRLVIR